MCQHAAACMPARMPCQLFKEATILVVLCPPHQQCSMYTLDPSKLLAHLMQLLP